MKILLLLLAAGCDENIMAFAQDLSSPIDLATEEPCAISKPFGQKFCSLPQNQFCYGFEATCVCLEGQWNCCNPQIWTCPPEPHTGDFCCPMAWHVCGGCDCIDGQLVCSSDGGERG